MVSELVNSREEVGADDVDSGKVWKMEEMQGKLPYRALVRFGSRQGLNEITARA